jgi:hypothetical protein
VSRESEAGAKTQDHNEQLIGMTEVVPCYKAPSMARGEQEEKGLRNTGESDPGRGKNLRG